MDTAEQLSKLAEQDAVYCLWKKCYLESAAAFAEFADRQTEEIRNILWTYAESGRLMQQRKVNLACEHMEFK